MYPLNHLPAPPMFHGREAKNLWSCCRDWVQKVLFTFHSCNNWNFAEQIILIGAWDLLFMYCDFCGRKGLVTLQWYYKQQQRSHAMITLLLLGSAVVIYFWGILSLYLWFLLSLSGDSLAYGIASFSWDFHMWWYVYHYTIMQFSENLNYKQIGTWKLK